MNNSFKIFCGNSNPVLAQEICDYLGIKQDVFHRTCDKFRPKHLWKKTKGEWKLRHNVNKTGTDD